MIKKRFGKVGGLSTMTFSERVVAIARMIPKGRVTTYGRIASAAGGGRMASRSVTSILGKAYERGIKDIPFHRIVYADGSIWMSDTHHKERMRKYKLEDIQVDERGRIKDFVKKLYEDPQGEGTK